MASRREEIHIAMLLGDKLTIVCLDGTAEAYGTFDFTVAVFQA
jgi:hypothetical protein